MNTTDQRLDQILHAFATTETSVGLEDRVLKHITHLATTPAPYTVSSNLRNAITSLLTSASPFAVPAAAFALLAVVFLTFVFHRDPQSIARHQAVPTLETQPQPQLISTARVLPPSVSLHSTQSLTQTTSPEFSADPDALALAETIAPSHPAPPLPLTAQEALLLRSTRPGQPIEIAELDTLRESALSHIAALRERATLRQYVNGLLGPLAAAQVLTSSSPQQDDASSLPNPEPPPSQ